MQVCKNKGMDSEMERASLQKAMLRIQYIINRASHKTIKEAICHEKMQNREKSKCFAKAHRFC